MPLNNVIYLQSVVKYERQENDPIEIVWKTGMGLDTCLMCSENYGEQQEERAMATGPIYPAHKSYLRELRPERSPLHRH
jgi:hypothetical protein